MELTVEQALQQGVAAHKESKLEDAERLYRAILQLQPSHPDANHNLGILAVSFNKVDAALPLFKIALEADPNIEQFWLSYIDALIKEKQFDNAKQVLEQGKNQGVAGEKLNILETQLAAITKQENVVGLSPSQELLSNLLEHYQAGRLDDAEKLAVSVTQEFPEHPFGWKVLGAVLKQMGKKSEAVNANQKAVELSPQGADAHNNLGITLKELGRLEEAETSLRQAIALKQDFSEAHFNLGNTLKELGRLDEAEESLRKVIALNPYHADAYNNLGNTLLKLKRSSESINCYKQAIKLKPDYLTARINLNKVTNTAVSAWHLSMMNDKSRNHAYFKAIKLAVDDGSFVLDIGTGSGLLSMMAAANGARDIITCETSTTIADTAKKIIHNNGYSETIKVINKKSTELIIGQDLPQKADLIISEVLSAEFVGEGVRTTMLDAKTRLLKKNGTMIPRSGDIRISLLGNNPEVSDSVSVGIIQGFDFSEFNSISPHKFNLNLKEKPILLSNPEEAFSINFYEETKLATQEKVIQLRANKDGLCLGVIQWLRVQLYKDIEYENSPGEKSSHWPTPAYIFDKPIAVKVGDVLEIRAFLDEDDVWFYCLK
jgi:tetratricopeptide (TPR) repeat protein